MKTTIKSKPQLKNNLKTKLIALLALAALPAFGSITTPLSNLNQPFGGGWFVGNVSSPAVSFTTGSQATSLSSITILAGLALSSSGYPSGDFILSLYNNSGSTPGSSLTTLTGSNPNSEYFAQYTYTDPNSTLLAPNTTYWIVASDPAGYSGHGYAWDFTDSTSTDSGSSWNLGQVTDYSGGSWVSQPGSELQFSVQVSDSSNTVAAVPEASTYMAGLSMAAILGLSFLRKSHPAAV